MKTCRIAVPLLLFALASFPACGEKKEEDKKKADEKFAADKGVTAISIDTLYEAKAHYAR